MEKLELCFNTLSLPAPSKEEAYSQFTSAIEGVCHIYNEKFSGMTSHIFYKDDAPSTIELYDQYTIADFFADLSGDNPDLSEFFLSLVTMAPFTKFVSNNHIYRISTDNYSINRWHTNIDIHRLALFWNMFLLSLPNNGWDTPLLDCHKNNDNTLKLKNICSTESAASHIPNIETQQRVFQLPNCRAYIYYGDHPPPHIHIRSPNIDCVISLKPDDYGALLCGAPLSPRDQQQVTEFLAEKPELCALWEEINPRHH